jgi:hypothetical protein
MSDKKLEAAASWLACELHAELSPESLRLLGGALQVTTRPACDALWRLGSGMSYLADTADPAASFLPQLQFRAALRGALDEGLRERLEHLDEPPWPAVVRAIKAASIKATTDERRNP